MEGYDEGGGERQPRSQGMEVISKVEEEKITSIQEETTVQLNISGDREPVTAHQGNEEQCTTSLGEPGIDLNLSLIPLAIVPLNLSFRGLDLNKPPEDEEESQRSQTNPLDLTIISGQGEMNGGLRASQHSWAENLQLSWDVKGQGGQEGTSHPGLQIRGEQIPEPSKRNLNKKKENEGDKKQNQESWDIVQYQRGSSPPQSKKRKIPGEKLNMVGRYLLNGDQFPKGQERNQTSWCMEEEV